MGADMHLSPPEYCRITEPTPVPVLCAFEVLLGESGGCMRDVLGNEINLISAMERGVHTSGVLASETGTLNYMLKHVAPAFEASRIVLPWLAGLERGEGDPLEPERRGSGES